MGDNKPCLGDETVTISPVSNERKEEREKLDMLDYF